MPQYLFTIWDGDTFVHREDLPNDEAAWTEAHELVGDAKSKLSPKGSEWSLVVARGEEPLYRIDVRMSKLG